MIPLRQQSCSSPFSRCIRDPHKKIPAHQLTGRAGLKKPPKTDPLQLANQTRVPPASALLWVLQQDANIHTEFISARYRYEFPQSSYISGFPQTANSICPLHCAFSLSSDTTFFTVDTFWNLAYIFLVMRIDSQRTTRLACRCTCRAQVSSGNGRLATAI
jgi:hypothetical protein